MTIEDIKKIEETLVIKLPESYKKTILNNPLADTTYTDAVADTLYDDPERIIRLNNRLRKRGLKGKPWLNNLFAIGYQFGNTYYFININDEDGNVYRADNTKSGRYTPEDLNINAVYHDMDAFLATPLIILKGEERRIKGVPEKPIDVNEFLIEMNEEILKQQKKNT